MSSASAFPGPVVGVRPEDSLVAAFTVVDIGALLGPEYVDVVQDVLRMCVIQFTIQFMMYLTDSQRFPFFTAEFILMLLYVALGVMIYWLVVRKVVGFR